MGRRWAIPPDPDLTLDSFRDGIGELMRGGEVVGHLAASVGTFRTPFSPRKGQWWVWLVAVWPDGTRERSLEDYPPWSYVDEMKRGFIQCDEWVAERRGRYEFQWLSTVDAARIRSELNISP
jgi:hypothetical protein